MSTGHSTHPRLLDDILGTGDGLSGLYSRSQVILKLQNRIRSGLDPQYSPHIHMADLSPPGVTLWTDSPGWAARLRYEIPRILEIITSDPAHSSISAIRIRVNPDLAPRPEPETPLTLSTGAAAFLKSVGEGTEDEGIRGALLRISNHR